MALNIGNNAVANAFVGSSQVRRAYKGGTLVYQGFGPASEQEFIQKEATGGPAQLLKVDGKSIVWNQLMASGDTLSVDNSEGTSVVVRHSVDADRARVPNHKYLCAANFNGQATSDTIIYMGFLSAEVINLIPGPCIISSTATSSETKFGIFVRVPAGGSIQGTITPVAIDLTLLYGAGKEPTSVAQFLADYTDALTAPYDPGSLQSNKTAELRAYDGGNLRGSLALNLSTLTGKLNGEGASVVVFPDGLRGVGSIRDEAYGSTGVVRLGKRAYQTGDESDTSVLTDGTNTIYPLATPLTYTLDTPLPTDLTCEQGDILQRVSDNNCPFVGEMRFGL